MTDNEIIKDFEKEIKYVRENEKYDDFNPIVDIDLCEVVLDLINRQKAEIEKLEATKNNYKSYYETTVFLLAEAYKTAEQVSENWEIGKINAIKEFAERLKNRMVWNWDFKNKIVFERDIDNLVKEMTEENENGGN